MGRLRRLPPRTESEIRASGLIAVMTRNGPFPARSSLPVQGVTDWLSAVVGSELDAGRGGVEAWRHRVLVSATAPWRSVCSRCRAPSSWADLRSAPRRSVPCRLKSLSCAYTRNAPRRSVSNSCTYDPQRGVHQDADGLGVALTVHEWMAIKSGHVGQAQRGYGGRI